MSKNERLKNRQHIHELYQNGRAFRSKNLNLIFQNRVTGRKVVIAAVRECSGAVERNLIKRKVREAFRLLKDNFPRETYYLFIAKRSVAACSLESLQSELAAMALKVAKHGSDSSEAHPHL